MPRYHNINGNQVQFTAAEETARDAEEAAWAAGAFDRAIAEVRSKRNRLLAETDFHGMSDNTMTSDMTTYRQNLRAERDRKIAATDYHALSDNTMSAEMTTYRQALRDITNGVTTQAQIDAISWPTKP